MKSSTARWTTAIVVAALLTVPSVSFAQTPSPASQPSAEQQAPTPQEPASPSSPSPSSPAAQQPASPSTGQIDPETVKRHLSAARDSLSQLTQLPAAAQLAGDSRTQVSQLITSFNELISSNSDWRGSLTKVQSSLSSLIGDQRTDESPAPAAGTAGAVGTSGTTTLDPSIRAKLVEFRTHLAEFERAAGGGASSAPDAPASPSASSSPSPSSSSPAAESSSPSASAASSYPSPSSASTAASPSPSESAATASPSEPAASSSSSSTAGAVGTSGRTPAASATAGASGSTAAAAHSDAARHIDAIEAILAGRSESGSGSGKTAGTSGSASGSSVTLTKAQIDEIKNHLTELRKGISQSGGR
jgi:hypothetical protein